MNRAEARERLGSSLEWICNTLWLAQRREPELVQLQEDRGSTGFPHYILSRAGNIPGQDWVEALYVMPPSLVEHLRPRCLGLEPAQYLEAALDAGAAALRRLHPHAQGTALAELARSSQPDGELPRAWLEMPSDGDPHRDLLWAAMTLREARAYVHYQAARAAGLQPLELLVLSAIWQGDDSTPIQRLFRWGDDELVAARESLGENGWLEEDGLLTPAGEERRDAIEARTVANTDRLLSHLSDAHLTELAAQLPDRA